MSSFDDLCSTLEKMDKQTFDMTFNEISVKVIEGLSNISDDTNDVVSCYLHFLLAAVSADGTLSPEEFEIIKPMFDRAAGTDTTYEDAVKIFKESGLDDAETYQKAVNAMVDAIGIVSPDLKDDIIMLSLMICAVDGEVSETEKQFVKQLYMSGTKQKSPMEFIDDYLGKCGSFVLATVDEGKPRTRVLGFKVLIEGRIYFAIGTFKDVYAQIMKNPNVEIMAMNGMEFLRWNGKAVFKDDQRALIAFTKALPDIAQSYADNNLTLAFFTIEGGSAEIVKVTNEKKKLF